MQTKLKLALSYTLGGLLVLGAVALAGSLIPEGPVGTPTMYTLSDIYNRLADINYTPVPHDISTTSSPASSMHSLSDIWNNFPTISSDIIASGTTIMGITGTLSTSTGYTYGDPSPDKVLTSAQGAGNVTLPPENKVEASYTYGPSHSLTGSLSTGGGAPTLTWQTDPGIALCLSTGEYETQNGCSAGNGWLDPNGDGSLLLGAVEYCQHLESDGTTISTSTTPNIWSLPNIHDLMSALNDQFFTGGSGQGGFQVYAGYWSGSGIDGDDGAWVGLGSPGGLWSDFVGNPVQLSVRCAH